MIKFNLLILLLIPSLSWGNTQYVTQTGARAIDYGSQDCTVANSVSIASINSGMASLGSDTLKLCDTEIFSTGLVINTSDDITVQAEIGDSPVFSGMTNCVTVTDVDDISLSGFTCQNTTGDGILATYTDGHSGLTIDNVTIDTTVESLVEVLTTNLKVVSNISITNSTFNEWASTGAVTLIRGIYLNCDAAEGAKTCSYDSVNVSNNTLISSGTQEIASDAIHIIRPDNYTVLKNIILGGWAAVDDLNESTHGIVIKSGQASASWAGSGTVAFNYVEATGDDNYWESRMSGLTVWYSNIGYGTGDDCFDTDDLSVNTFWVNNTCINPFSICFEFRADSTASFINNICYTDYIPNTCVEGTLEEHSYINILPNGATNPDLADLYTENNLFYSSAGRGTYEFRVQNRGASSCGVGEFAGTFEQWQAQTEAPDQNSIYSNPLLELTRYAVTKQDSPALRAGQDVCDLIDGYLEVGSTWPDNVIIFHPCPALACNGWNIGAYGTRGDCPDDVDYDGYAVAQGDCDDADSAVNPGAVEIWYDGTDQNCDGWNDYDQDMDTYVDGAWNSEAGGTSPGTNDCDDGNAGLNPDTYWYEDSDSDNYGNPALSLQQCVQPTDFVLDSSDCDDYDENIYPGGLPTRVIGVTTEYYLSLQSAYDNATESDTIQSQEIMPAESLLLDSAISVILEGGCDCDYVPDSGVTTINGNVTINDGRVTIQDGTFKIQ